MALYHQEIYTTTGVKTSVMLDPSIAPFNCNVAVTLSATAIFSLEVSLSDVNVPDSAALWFTPTAFASASLAVMAPVNAPVSRIRANITALTGSLTLQTAQGFTIN